jgi:hypothetical protein
VHSSTDAPPPSPPPSDPPRADRLGAFLFLRALGLVYLIAFASLWVQVDGLIGSRGILPIADFLQQVERARPDLGFADLPTLCWFQRGDSFLHVQCAAGVVAALALLAGLVPTLACALLWLLYLSLSVAGQVFLGYQWDALLLEAGLLAIFLAPPVWRSRRASDPAPPAVVRWLLRWLVFRLMFLSGVVKLASRDPAWHDLSALTYHFWTQPLPAWTAWYVHQLPVPLLKAGCGIMFAIELVLPFCVFGPRRVRRVAAIAFAGLMLVIALTGNYTFFNLLTAALCLPLLDDRAFPVRWRTEQPARPLPAWWRRGVLGALAALVLLVSVPTFLGACRVRVPWPGALERLHAAVGPFRSINGYGLFAVMTRTRPEIVIEGSRDGVTWTAYPFRWKPGDPGIRPRFVAPHQPRLDWQMWFAALGDYQGNPWLIRFMVRLLEGSPPVQDLLAGNPFPDAPPRYLRATTWDYRFCTQAERAATGDWWVRGNPRPYTPVLARREP